MAETGEIIAICGKGGVGKTAVSALLSQAVIKSGISPVLLVDADPAGGFFSAIGESVPSTLSEVRSRLIESASTADSRIRAALASSLDYMVMESLSERKHYSMLAMGRSIERGCFCPANSLLRGAIDSLSGSFATVIIDAEAGLEQINRKLTRSVSLIITVIDGSDRSIKTAGVIAGMEPSKKHAIIMNMATGEVPACRCSGEFIGAVPFDDMLREYDRTGRPLWELPNDNPAVSAAVSIAKKVFFN